MLSFECDYNTGAHPKLLEALAKTNLEPQPGYGEDEYCLRAAEKIREACRTPEAAVRSAQMVLPRAAFSTLQPVNTAPSSHSSAAPTAKRE